MLRQIRRALSQIRKLLMLHIRLLWSLAMALTLLIPSRRSHARLLGRAMSKALGLLVALARRSDLMATTSPSAAAAAATATRLLGRRAHVVGLQVARELGLRRRQRRGCLHVEGWLSPRRREAVRWGSAGEELSGDAEAQAGRAGGVRGGGGRGRRRRNQLLEGVELLRGLGEALLQAVDLLGEVLVRLGEVLDAGGEAAFDGGGEVRGGFGHVFHFAAQAADVVVDGVGLLAEVAVVGRAVFGIFFEFASDVVADGDERRGKLGSNLVKVVIDDIEVRE